MIGNFFKISYWFDLTPGGLAPGAVKLIAAFLIFLFVIAFFSYILQSRRQSLYAKIWKKMLTFGSANLALGLFLLFFAYEGLPFLSARFLFPAWGAGMAAWLFFILRHLTEIPKIKQKKAAEDEFKKYLP